LRGLVVTLARESQEPQDMWSRSYLIPGLPALSFILLRVFASPCPTLPSGSRRGHLHGATLPPGLLIAQPRVHGYARAETIDLRQDVGDLRTWSPKQTVCHHSCVGTQGIPLGRDGCLEGTRRPRGAGGLDRDGVCFHPIPSLHLAALPWATLCEPRQTPLWPAFLSHLARYTAALLTSGHHDAFRHVGLTLLPWDQGVCLCLCPRWTSGVSRRHLFASYLYRFLKHPPRHRRFCIFDRNPPSLAPRPNSCLSTSPPSVFLCHVLTCNPT
jgi:hypothetical protein